MVRCCIRSPFCRNMNPNQPSLNVYDALHQSQNTLDPLDEFLSRLLFDIPDPLPIPIPTYASAFTPAPTSLATSFPHLTCNWVSPYSPLICGTPLPPNPKDVVSHFRLVHKVRGNDKAIAGCHWHACRAPPMQRGSVIRHILTVHLGLLRWQCEGCGRVFSRKGTEHVCGGREGA